MSTITKSNTSSLSTKTSSRSSLLLQNKSKTLKPNPTTMLSSAKPKTKIKAKPPNIPINSPTLARYSKSFPNSGKQQQKRLEAKEPKSTVKKSVKSAKSPSLTDKFNNKTNNNNKISKLDAIPTLEEDNPIHGEITSIVCEIENFRSKLHELGRIQESHHQFSKLNPKRLSAMSLISSGNMEEENNVMVQAVNNQLSVVQQHISSLMDNHSMLDDNLLSIIMTYNEEVNTALKEAIQEVPRLYSTSSNSATTATNTSTLTPTNNNYENIFSYMDDESEFKSSFGQQQLIETQAMQIQFLENASFNNIYQLQADAESCQCLLSMLTKFDNNCGDKCCELNLSAEQLESRSFLTNNNLLEVKIEEIKNLIRKYDCKTEIDYDDYIYSDKSKAFLSNLLQRVIIETILEHSEVYFNGSLDRCIKYSKDPFIDLMDSPRLSKETFDFDNLDSKKTYKTRINPEVYAVLGTKNFDGFDHPFIEFVLEKLLKTLKKYCKIKCLDNDNGQGKDNKNPKKIFNNILIEIIHKIINLFYFGMQAHDKSLQFKWLDNNLKFDRNLMKMEDVGEEIEKLSLDICSFPLIGIDLSDKDACKVIVKAKFYPLLANKFIPGQYPKID
ncbi:11197_t:CDS:2 [Entrophospora sp. SA101]|nr:9960_t:CDS:2 [Entrophospora sp. SA101]CAJ0825524.1 11197_t:CDS:2 [Entrophospora sp. SA101]